MQRHVFSTLGLAACAALAGCASPGSVAQISSGLVAAQPLQLEQMQAPAPHSRAVTAGGSAVSEAVATVTKQTKKGKKAASGNRWALSGSLAGWMPAVDGTFVAGGGGTRVDSSISDTGDDMRDHLFTGLVARVRAESGDFGVFGSLERHELDLETNLVGANVELEPDVRIIEFGGTCVLDRISYAGDYEHQSRRGDELDMRFDFLFGVRHTDVETNIDVVSAPAGINAAQSIIAGDRDADWWDLILGVQVDADLCETTRVVARFDVGGFDLGSSSDQTWNLELTLHHSFTDKISAFAGWRVLDSDYDRGSGANRFEWDVRMAGPTAGLEIRF